MTDGRGFDSRQLHQKQPPHYTRRAGGLAGPLEVVFDGAALDSTDGASLVENRLATLSQQQTQTMKHLHLQPEKVCGSKVGLATETT